MRLVGSEVAWSSPLSAWHVYAAVSLTRALLNCSEKSAGSTVASASTRVVSMITPSRRHSTRRLSRSAGSVRTSHGSRTTSLTLAVTSRSGGLRINVGSMTTIADKQSIHPVFQKKNNPNIISHNSKTNHQIMTIFDTFF